MKNFFKTPFTSQMKFGILCVLWLTYAYVTNDYSRKRIWSLTIEWFWRLKDTTCRGIMMVNHNIKDGSFGSRCGHYSIMRDLIHMTCESLKLNQIIIQDGLTSMLLAKWPYGCWYVLALVLPGMVGLWLRCTICYGTFGLANGIWRNLNWLEKHLSFWIFHIQRETRV